MAKVIIKFKVMPESAESDLGDVKKTVSTAIESFGGIINGDLTEEPVAFGLKSIHVSFAYDEGKGTTDDLEDQLAADDNIQSVEVLSVGRAMG